MKLTFPQATAVRNAMRDVRRTEDAVLADGVPTNEELGERVEEAIRARRTLKAAVRSARRSMA